MSIKVMSAVWEHSAHKEGTLVVLLALADYAQDDGRNAFPSVETLAKKARMSERNARYCLRRLEESGEIARTGKHGAGVTVYRICVERWGANPAPANIAPAKPAGGQLATPQGGNLRQQGGQPVAPKPSIEPSSESNVGLTPYGLFAAVCEEADLDASGYTQREKGKHLAVAKRLIDDGVTEKDVRAHVRWLQSQEWRSAPITLFTVEKEIGGWRAAGRPKTAVARASPSGNGAKAHSSVNEYARLAGLNVEDFR